MIRKPPEIDTNTLRAISRAPAAKKLADLGVPFKVYDDGKYLIVAGRFDYWTETGLWKLRAAPHTNPHNCGVEKLIQSLRKLKVLPPEITKGNTHGQEN